MIAETADWIAMGRDVVVAISAGAAALFAYLGLTTWRRELKGKSEYQLAKDVLKAVYRVRDGFSYVRNPVIHQHEYPEDMRNPRGGLKPENQFEGASHVYQKRWERLAEPFEELEQLYLDALVEWGPQYKDVILKLRSRRVDLLIAVEDMLERKKNPNLAPRSDKEDLAKERSILYQIGPSSKHDQFTPEIEAAIDEFENWLRPHIKHGRKS